MTGPAMHSLPDVQQFTELLRNLEKHDDAAVRRSLDPAQEVVVGRAPGRLDVMGGIADYSGSLVLEMPLKCATLVAAQKDPQRRVRVVTLGDRPGSPVRSFEIPLAALEDGEASTYESARDFFRREEDNHWAAYPVGVLLVLMRERGVRPEGGIRMLIASHVPEGKGVSSSAALEVATMSAVKELLGVAIEPEQMAVLCQKAENLVVGAPCGVMDQMTAALGRKDELLELLCQPAEVRGSARIPDELSVWGIDSGIRHQVSGADYTSVRTAAFMGYRIIADEAGLEAHPTETPGLVRTDDPHWHGYLANVTPAELQRRFAAALPETMRGDEFLGRYAGTTDSVTRVLPEVDYPVLAATAHPIDEHDRVTRFARLLGEPQGAETWQALGELMYGSHDSYSRCGLGSDGTDDLVRRVRQRGPAAGLFGAKITGGGCGGTVAVLGRADAGDGVQALAERYAHESGHDPTVFAGSSDGAAATGCLRLVPAGADGLG